MQLLRLKSLFVSQKQGSSCARTININLCCTVYLNHPSVRHFRISLFLHLLTLCRHLAERENGGMLDVVMMF